MVDINIKMAFRASNGRYLTVRSGSPKLLVGDFCGNDTFGVFTLVERGENGFALQAWNSKFVCAEQGGGGVINVDRDWTREWETFTLAAKWPIAHTLDSNQPPVLLGPTEPLPQWRTLLVNERPVDGMQQQPDRYMWSGFGTYDGQHFVSLTGGAYAEVAATATSFGPNETFTPIAIHLDGDAVSIIAANGKLLSAMQGGGGDLCAQGAQPLQWEALRQVTLVDDYVALRGPDGRYVSIAGGAKLQVTASALGQTEVFKRVQLDGTDFALLAHNGRYVTLQRDGTLVAASTSINVRERFGPWADRRSADTYVAWMDVEKRAAFVTSNGTFVSAMNGGGGDLLPLGVCIDAWERMTFVSPENGGGRMAIRGPDGRYATIANGPKLQMTATSIGPNELFDVSPDYDRFLLRASNGKFVTAGSNGAGPLAADGDVISAAHEFTFVTSNLHMVARGGGSDDHLYSAKLRWYNNAACWLDYAVLPLGNKSTSSPAVVTHAGVTYMVHRGGGNKSLWWTTYNHGTGTWNEDIEFTNGNRSDSPPGLAVFNGTIYCVHKGNNDNEIWYCTFDQTSKTWTEDKRFQNGNKCYEGTPIINYQQELTWEQLVGGMFPKDTLICVHRGHSDTVVLNKTLSEADRHLYFSIFDSNTLTWGEDAEFIHDNRTGRTPALAVLNGTLYCVHCGFNDSTHPGDDQIYYSTFDLATKTWSEDKLLGNNARTTSGVGLIAWANALYCIYGGSRNGAYPQSVYWCKFDSASKTWSPEYGAPGIHSGDGPTLFTLPL